MEIHRKIETARPTEFQKPVARINRKAKRYGVPGIEAKEIGKELRTQNVNYIFEGREVNQEERSLEVTIFEVKGQTFQLKGWELAAFSTPMEGDRNLVQSPAFLESAPVDDRFKELGTKCEHCDTKRNRNSLFILRNNETGEEKQVGKTCLKDFITDLSPEKLSFMSEAWVKLSDYENAEGESFGASRKGGVAVRTETVVAFAAAAIRTHGWKAKQTDDWGDTIGRSTAGIIGARIANKPTDEVTEGYFEEIEITEEDREKAREALEWVQQKADEERKAYEEETVRFAEEWKLYQAGERENEPRQVSYPSSYIRDLSNLAEYEFVPDNRAAILASLSHTYDKHLEEIQREKEMATLGHVGEIGKREEFDVILERRMSFATDWGMTFWEFYRLEDNNVMVWKGKGSDLEEGDRAVINATVSGHSEYKGAKQTEVKRVKVVRLIEEEETVEEFNVEKRAASSMSI